MSFDFDIAIVGGGAAGLTAAIYSGRARRRTVLFERELVGGQIATTERVENYPGFPDGVDGPELAQRFQVQAERFGAQLRYESVESLEPLPEGGFLLRTSADTYRVAAVIVTAGAQHRKLGVPGEAEFLGKGVSYCATCDGAFFRDRDVVVVGGGDSALDEAIFLTRFARSVTVIHRRDQLRASALLQQRAFANDRIRFRFDSVVTAIEGNEVVDRVRLRDVKTGAESVLPTAGVFIFIGQIPNSHLLAGLVELDEGGHAKVDLEMQTSIPGLFVAGDVRWKAARQLVAAAGDGATAAIAAERYLQEIIGPPPLGE